MSHSKLEHSFKDLETLVIIKNIQDKEETCSISHFFSQLCRANHQGQTKWQCLMYAN